jgi:hypothetical protein
MLLRLAIVLTRRVHRSRQRIGERRYHPALRHL